MSLAQQPILQRGVTKARATGLPGEERPIPGKKLVSSELSTGGQSQLSPKLLTRAKAYELGLSDEWLSCPLVGYQLNLR